jgi:hypothetical protein
MLQKAHKTPQLTTSGDSIELWCCVPIITNCSQHAFTEVTFPHLGLPSSLLPVSSLVQWFNQSHDDIAASAAAATATATAAATATATAAAAAAFRVSYRCSSRVPTPEEMRRVERQLQRHRDRMAREGRQPTGPFVVPTVFHVIRSSAGAGACHGAV